LSVASATFTSGSTLQINIIGFERNLSEYGTLNASGNVGLDGALVVNLVSSNFPFPPFVLLPGDSFDILNGALSGHFNSITLPALSAGFVWDTSNLYTTGILSVALARVPGDYNGNGIVDVADYTLWRDTVGQTGAGLATDGNGDGVVNQQDYQFWV